MCWIISGHCQDAVVAGACEYCDDADLLSSQTWREDGPTFKVRGQHVSELNADRAVFQIQSVTLNQRDTSFNEFMVPGDKKGSVEKNKKGSALLCFSA
jgi:hypothetical protein